MRPRRPGARPPARPLAGAPALALAVAAVLAVAVSSCAPPGQRPKPGASQEHGDRDSAECRSLARAESERRYRAAASEVDSPAYGSGRTLEREMGRYEAERFRRSLFERCLRARGHPAAEPRPPRPAPDK